MKGPSKVDAPPPPGLAKKKKAGKKKGPILIAAFVVLIVLPVGFIFLSKTPPKQSTDTPEVVAPASSPAAPATPAAAPGTIPVPEKATAPAEVAPAPAEVAPAPVATPPGQIEIYLASLEPSVMTMPDKQNRLILSNVIYPPGSIIEPRLKITFVKAEFERRLLYFKDEAGRDYTRSF